MIAARTRGPVPAARRAFHLSLLLLASAFAAARPAGATLAPAAKPVVDRYLEALGGRAAFERIQSVYERGAIQAFGLSGKAEFWSQRPDRTATVFSIGPITVTDGWDGTTAWRIDPGGKLVRRDGKDLEDARSDAYFENDRWLDPDQAGGTVNSLGTQSDSSGTYAVLEITPPVGRGRKLYFDARTGLLARTVTRRDQNTAISSLSDYRPVEGVLRPFRQHVHIVELPANDASVTIDSVVVNPAIPASRFAPPVETAEAVRWLGTPGLAHVPFHYQGRHVWLQVAVNGGPPQDFIFDTGASVTVLDSAAAARLGVKTEGRQQGIGAGASGGASFARLDSVTVAGANGEGVVLRDLRIGVLSINPVLAPYFWKEAVGVLGFDFISRFVTDIDYDSGTLTFHDPKSYHHEGKGTAVPMTLAGTIPVVQMTLDGKWQAPFRVDVGSGSLLDLHTPFVKEHGILALPGKTMEVTGGGFGGSFTSTVRRMKSLSVAGYTVSGPLVGLSHATSGGFASEDYAGNLGNRFLDRFHVTLDYERRTLWLEPGRRYAEPDVFTRSGIQLLKSDGVVRAAIVLPGSPAAKAGLREGDEVVAIDGSPVAEWDPDRVFDTLDRGKPGSRHTIGVKRDAQPVTVAITLREQL